MTVHVDPYQPVRLHELTYLDDGGEITVGRTDIDSYCVLPADGAAVLRRLESGMAPAQAAAWYVATYREPVDIDEFVATLAELGFLVQPGDEPAKAVRWQRLGGMVFSRPAAIGYAAVVVAAVVLMIGQPDLAPHYRNLFFTRYMTLLMLGAFLGQLPLILLHEAFHALAGRRLGLPSSLSIGRRLYFIVFETSLDGLVTVPRRQRYLPMLAGMLADSIAVAGLTCAAAVTRHPDGSQPLAGAFCLAIAFGTTLRIVWQFYFFLQTDLYHVAATALRCNDLQLAARRTLRNRLWRALRRPDRVLDESTWHARDRAVARWYSWLLLVGYAASITTLILAVIPTAVRVLASVSRHLVDGAGPGSTADSLVFFGLGAAQLAVLVGVAVRERRNRRIEPTRLVD